MIETFAEKRTRLNAALKEKWLGNDFDWHNLSDDAKDRYESDVKALQEELQKDCPHEVTGIDFGMGTCERLCRCCGKVMRDFSNKVEQKMPDGTWKPVK